MELILKQSSIQTPVVKMHILKPNKSSINKRKKLNKNTTILWRWLSRATAIFLTISLVIVTTAPRSLAPQSYVSLSQNTDKKPPALSSSHPANEATSPLAAPSNTASPITHVVRFQSENAKQTFLEKNNLSVADLTTIPELGGFGVRAGQLLTTSGVQTFVNQHYSALLTPTDPLAANQWHLTNTNTNSAWNHQVGNANITVAVIDTGFGLNVTDLTSAWDENDGETGSTSSEGPAPNCTSQSLSVNKRCNNLDDDSDGYIDNHLGWNFTEDTNDVSAGQLAPNADVAYHGTAVASLIAGRANNSAGGTGISWGAKILPIQVLDDYGDGYTVSVALGIRYAVDQGANIINLSLGADADDPLVSEQIDYATQNGVVVVAASGNDGCNCIAYPARYPSVIAVGATNSSNTLANFSSYGANLDLVAPGVGLCSTAWTNANPSGLNACGLNGTSFASPIVAGTAALLLSQNPTLTPAQVTTALTGTATKLAPMNGANFTNLYGYGLLNTLTSLNDVSATSSIGSPLSASRISIAELDDELAGYEYDKFNSTCLSTVNDVTCTTRAINTLTNQLIPIASNLTPNGTHSLQQDLLSANLTSGTWIIQTYLTTPSGIQSMVREKTLVIDN